MSEEERQDGRFQPRTAGHHPLFLDTSALYARFYAGASQHGLIQSFFDALRGDDLPYRPLLTNRWVIDELVSLLLADAGHDAALRAVDALHESAAVTVLAVDDDAYADALAAFRRYDDQAISLTDHTIAVQATAADAKHVLTFDGDFATLDLEPIPRR